MALRILCTGDVHLGRRPAGIADDLGIDSRGVGPAGAWEAFVDAAIRYGVDAVALTGDVVDESNKFYEAFSALQAGVVKLAESGIPLYAVAGNHDYDVLPRLAEQIPRFHLLGQAGQWEEAVLELDGGAVLRFQGWSFPRRHVAANPLVGYSPPTDGIPTVGLLHCDCDAPGSPYGPVSSDELRAKAPTVWVLGHVHRPGAVLNGPPLGLYCGSPQGLDPSERGAHGAWLVTLEPGRDPQAELLPLAALRWEPVEVSLEGVASLDGLPGAVISALGARHGAIASELGRARWVGCRLRLTGRTALHRQLPGQVGEIRELRYPTDEAEYFVEKVEDDTRPAVALEELARSPDPAGLLACRLVVLERSGPAEEYRALIDGARRRIEDDRSARARYFSQLAGSDPPDEQEVRALLLKAGWRALDALLAQKEGGG